MVLPLYCNYDRKLRFKNFYSTGHRLYPYGTEVEHLTHNLEIGGLNPATGTLFYKTFTAVSYKYS